MDKPSNVPSFSRQLQPSDWEKAPPSTPAPVVVEGGPAVTATVAIPDDNHAGINANLEILSAKYHCFCGEVLARKVGTTVPVMCMRLWTGNKPTKNCTRHDKIMQREADGGIPEDMKELPEFVTGRRPDKPKPHTLRKA